MTCSVTPGSVHEVQRGFFHLAIDPGDARLGVQRGRPPGRSDVVKDGLKPYVKVVVAVIDPPAEWTAQKEQGQVQPEAVVQLRGQLQQHILPLLPL